MELELELLERVQLKLVHQHTSAVPSKHHLLRCHVWHWIPGLWPTVQNTELVQKGVAPVPTEN
jgi:hypothetical protein